MCKKNVLQRVMILVLSMACLAACSTGPVKPQPGATLSGTISMDSAKTARVVLKVSGDGQSIESVGFEFTELKCEGFSAGSSSSTTTSLAPIVDGKFEFKTSDGVVSGQFKSPTAAQGSVHVAFYDGQAECGTWDWSASAK
jgi:hypothetical protein